MVIVACVRVAAAAVATLVGVALVCVLFRGVVAAPDERVLLRPGDASSGARDYWAMHVSTPCWR